MLLFYQVYISVFFPIIFFKYYIFSCSCSCHHSALNSYTNRTTICWLKILVKEVQGILIQVICNYSGKKCKEILAQLICCVKLIGIEKRSERKVDLMICFFHFFFNKVFMVCGASLMFNPNLGVEMGDSFTHLLVLAFSRIQ